MRGCRRSYAGKTASKTTPAPQAKRSFVRVYSSGGMPMRSRFMHVPFALRSLVLPRAFVPLPHFWHCEDRSPLHQRVRCVRNHARSARTTATHLFPSTTRTQHALRADARSAVVPARRKAARAALAPLRVRSGELLLTVLLLGLFFFSFLSWGTLLLLLTCPC